MKKLILLAGLLTACSSLGEVGDACSVADADCEEGLHCMPDEEGVDEGTCMENMEDEMEEEGTMTGM